MDNNKDVQDVRYGMQDMQVEVAKDVKTSLKRTRKSNLLKRTENAVQRKSDKQYGEKDRDMQRRRCGRCEEVSDADAFVMRMTGKIKDSFNADDAVVQKVSGTDVILD